MWCRVLPGHSNAVVSLKFSVDGQRLASASADKTAKIWDPFSGRCLVTLEGHTKVATFSGADCGVWSECPLMIGLWGEQTCQDNISNLCIIGVQQSARMRHMWKFQALLCLIS